MIFEFLFQNKVGIFYVVVVLYCGDKEYVMNLNLLRNIGLNELFLLELEKGEQ